MLAVSRPERRRGDRHRSPPRAIPPGRRPTTTLRESSPSGVAGDRRCRPSRSRRPSSTGWSPSSAPDSTSSGTAVKVGDAGRGQALFDGKGACATCHRVNGKGPRVAPGLERHRRRPSRRRQLQRSLLDPTTAMLPINRPVRIVTRDGRTIRGRRLNEDTVHRAAHRRAGAPDLARQARHPRVSIWRNLRRCRSVAGTLTADELADVIAYLLSLRGAVMRTTRTCIGVAAHPARRSSRPPVAGPARRRSPPTACCAPPPSRRTGSPTTAPTPASATARSRRLRRPTSTNLESKWVLQDQVLRRLAVEPARR